MESYHPSQWREYENNHPACSWSQHTPDSGLYNHTYIAGDMPRRGYPYHKALIEGLNDTLTVIIALNNRSDTDYDLTNKKYDQWFAPQVYQMWVPDSGGPAFRDSTELKYRVRGWYTNRMRIATPTKIPARSPYYSFRLDIWNLPSEGRYQICILPTQNVASDFTATTNGYVFEYYPAQSLADSINAYEACFWRAYEDNDSTACSQWTNKILTINPKSVVGWWLVAFRSTVSGDTTGTKQALDKAIGYFYASTDPCMPDSTERALRTNEIEYLDWVRGRLNYSRASYGP
jgi:hypothetical protein